MILLTESNIELDLVVLDQVAMFVYSPNYMYIRISLVLRILTTCSILILNAWVLWEIS